jgi:hypothetical protein
MSDAATYWIKTQAGEDFAEVFNLQNDDGSPVNLTGYTARMQVRRTHKATTPALSLTSPDAGLVINGAAGTITVSVSNAQTSALCLDNDRTQYVYDLEIESGAGLVTKVSRGFFTVLPEATR